MPATRRSSKNVDTPPAGPPAAAPKKGKASTKVGSKKGALSSSSVPSVPSTPTPPPQPTATGQKRKNTATPSATQAAAALTTTATPTRVEISQEEFHRFQLLQKKKGNANKKNNAKALKAAEEREIQHKNSQLLEEHALENQPDEENDDNNNESGPVAKKSKTAHFVLSDDEEDLANSLGHRVQETSNLDGDSNNGDKEGNEDNIDNDPADNDMNDNHEEDEDEDEDEEDENEDEEDEDENTADADGNHKDLFNNNGMSVSASSKNKNSKAISRSLLSRPKCSDFSPEMGALADASWAFLRKTIAIGDYLKGPECDDGIMDVIKKVAKEHRSNFIFKSAWTKLLSDINLQQSVSAYVKAGKSGLFTAIIGKTRSVIVGHYSLTGPVTTVAERVAWLKFQSHFMFGNVNAQNQTYNKNMPFCNAVIKDVIESVWFSGTGKAKADVSTTMAIIKSAYIPISVVLLVVTAIEHALGERTTGVMNQIDYREQYIRNRYAHHYASWKDIQKKSPSYAKNYPTKLFEAIAKSCSMKTLLADDEAAGAGDMEDVEGADLDAAMDNRKDLFD